MAISRDDLLKFSKTTDLIIDEITDDSSKDTEVKILNLATPVTATGSITTTDGHNMSVTSNQVYVAAEDIDLCLNDMVEENGKLVYKGMLHLDVSKPKGSLKRDGSFAITQQARVWLTATKFNKRGSKLRENNQTSLGDIINDLFKTATPVDLTKAVNTSTEEVVKQKVEKPQSVEAKK